MWKTLKEWNNDCMENLVLINKKITFYLLDIANELQNESEKKKNTKNEINIRSFLGNWISSET